MFERFTSQARSVVTHAQQEARELGHPRVGTEHLLLAVLDAPDTAGARALSTLGIDTNAVRDDVQRLDRERVAFSDEDTLARRLMLEKYGPRSGGDLSSWGRTALVVAIDWPSATTYTSLV